MGLAARNGRLDGKADVGSHLPVREFGCHVADSTRAPGDSSRSGLTYFKPWRRGGRQRCRLHAPGFGPRPLGSRVSASEAVDRPRPIRDRFPPPGGSRTYRLTDVHGRPLAQVYGVDGSARAALPDGLTPTEASAIATAIARLPDIMPAQ
jgi:hypothetical protein